MKAELANFLVEAGNNNGMDCRIYEKYAGRSMYGQTTTGVVIDGGGIGDLMLAVISEMDYVSDEKREELSELAGKMQKLNWDNLGLGTIIY